jgi:hypothetical protein
MNDRGFSWRQTTVAKSEAADRPVLFAEVAALAQIYNQDIEYFMYPGSELDSILDEAVSELEGSRIQLQHAEGTVAAVKSDIALYERTVGLASSFRRYRNSSDSGVLRNDLEALLRRWGVACLTGAIDDVYESIDVSKEQLRALDHEALTEVARIEWRRHQALAERDLVYESPEMLAGVGDFLNGKEVPPALIDALRLGEGWVSFAVSLLTDLVIRAVDAQRD